jgi:Domain of unknown function (DUF3471)
MGLVEYVVEWPAVAKIDPKRYDDYVGRYDGGNNRYARVLKDGDRLLNLTVNGRKLELLRIGEDKFYMADTEVEVTFLRNEKGEIIERQVDVNGAVSRQKKVKEPAAGGN